MLVQARGKTDESGARFVYVLVAMTTPINEWNCICISTGVIQLSCRTSPPLYRPRQFIGWGNLRSRRTNKQDPRPKGCSLKYRREFCLISSLKQGKHTKKPGAVTREGGFLRWKIDGFILWAIRFAWCSEKRSSLRSGTPTTTSFDIISERIRCIAIDTLEGRENETYCIAEHVSRNENSLYTDVRSMSEYFSTLPRCNVLFSIENHASYKNMATHKLSLVAHPKVPKHWLKLLRIKYKKNYGRERKTIIR